MIAILNRINNRIQVSKIVKQKCSQFIRGH